MIVSSGLVANVIRCHCACGFNTPSVKLLHRTHRLMTRRASSTGNDAARSISLTTPLWRRRFTLASDGDELEMPEFKIGDKVLAEVIFFGPLGASVDIVAHGSHSLDECIPQDEPALGRGIVYQKEINYFRRSRGMVDVVRDEILPGYVEKIRHGDFEHNGEYETRLDVSLRPIGGKAKALELGPLIVELLKDSPDGTLDIGDKSKPEEIDALLPGTSKAAFKRAVSALFKQGVVKPGKKKYFLM